RYPQPDPRRQDPPDIFDDADRPGQVRNADVQPIAGDALSQTPDLARRGNAAVIERRRTERTDRARFRIEPILYGQRKTRGGSARRRKPVRTGKADRPTPARTLNALSFKEHR